MSSLPTLEGDYDYIIVGAGTAGCVLANRLTEDDRTRVLLLEAGRSDRYPWVRIPVGYLYCMGNPHTDWMMKTEPEPGLNGRSFAYPRGNVLGGCSSISRVVRRTETIQTPLEAGGPGPMNTCGSHGAALAGGSGAVTREDEPRSVPVPPAPRITREPADLILGSTAA